jgi:hypothetical protein
MISLVYMMYTVPAQVGLEGIGSLPWENKVMAGMFVCVELDHQKACCKEADYPGRLSTTSTVPSSPLS